jgi:hypothetical protein
MVSIPCTGADQDNRYFIIKRPYCLGSIPTSNASADDYHTRFARDHDGLGRDGYCVRLE